jgi:hypothetical protein
MNINPFSSGFYQNPADDAMGIMNGIPDTIKPYYDPYINAGKNSLSILQDQYSSLLNDPSALMSLLGGKFSESPGYKFQYDQGMNAANAAAASGGFAGTPQHQFNASSLAQNFANKDYYDYLDRTLGLYNTGLRGYGDINQMGYNASNELANSLANLDMNKANMSYLGQSNQNQANSDLFSTILSGATSLGSWLYNRRNPQRNTL